MALHGGNACPFVVRRVVHGSDRFFDDGRERWHQREAEVGEHLRDALIGRHRPALGRVVHLALQPGDALGQGPRVIHHVVLHDSEVAQLVAVLAVFLAFPRIGDGAGVLGLHVVCRGDQLIDHPHDSLVGDRFVLVSGSAHCRCFEVPGAAWRGC